MAESQRPKSQDENELGNGGCEAGEEEEEILDKVLTLPLASKRSRKGQRKQNGEMESLSQCNSSTLYLQIMNRLEEYYSTLVLLLCT